MVIFFVSGDYRWRNGHTDLGCYWSVDVVGNISCLNADDERITNVVVKSARMQPLSEPANNRIYGQDVDVGEFGRRQAAHGNYVAMYRAAMTRL